mgnify:CR=1 FL=1
MFKNLGKLEYKTKTQNVNIDLELIEDGVNFTEEFIILKKNDQLSVYDRICDHNSGKLISKLNCLQLYSIFNFSCHAFRPSVINTIN